MRTAMELLYTKPLCRLCAEENDNGTYLFTTEENQQDLRELINKYLPLKVDDDSKFPRTICPGCNIQLEATKSFMDLIVAGQEKLRQLYKSQQEKIYRQEKQKQQLQEALRNVNPNSSVDTYTIQSDETGEKFVIQIFSNGPLFPPEHELALRAEGLSRPKRKRGRPPKPRIANKPDEDKPDDPLELEKTQEPSPDEDLNNDGKRKRRIKVPSRYSEAIQGKELDKVFKQQGVIDEESLSETDMDYIETTGKQTEEIIGHLENENGEDLGQPVVINRNYHRIRGRTSKAAAQTRKRRRYKCEICGREFLHHGRYELHKKSHEVDYKCGEESCEFKSNQKIALERHLEETGHIGFEASEKIDQYGTLQLPSEITIKSEDDDLQEKTSPANENPSQPRNKADFLCEACNKKFSCKQNYEVHLRAVHRGQRPFFCRLCERSFSYSNSLKLHLLKHVPKSDEDKCLQYQCPYCPKAFKHPSSLQYHRDAEHTNGRRFVCNKCHKHFKHRQLLQRHQLVHSDERPYICSQCQSAFKTRANLIHHTRTVHAGQKSHWCSQCGKSFAHKTALKMHQRWHTGVRPYQCEFCQKSFSQKGNLAEHRRIHTGEKPYICEHCNKPFTTSSQYRLHKKTHFDERPHKCEHCPKSFLHKVTLKCHMRRHFDDKPFKCEYCSKAFPESWAMKKHMRLHTGEKPHKCEVCSKAFADSSNLVKHRRTHLKQEAVATAQKSMIYVTYDKEEAILTYIEPQTEQVLDSIEATNVVNEDVEGLKTVHLQQLVDQEGNPITFTTQDGQIVKVVTSMEDGQENIQGLLPDGTLVPISIQDKQQKTVGHLEGTVAEKLDDVSVEGLPTIQFLNEADASKVPSNIQFMNEDNQNMCFVTAYNINDAINPQYLSLP